MAQAGDQWGSLGGDARDAVAYVRALPEPYVDDTLVHARLGPLQTPRVYAYGLDTLELASSGRIAVTLDDRHALDIARQGDDTVALRAVPDLALALYASAGADVASVGLAGASATLGVLGGGGGLASGVAASPAAVTVTAASSADGTAASFTATTAGSAGVTASSNVTLAAGPSSVALSSEGSVVLSVGPTRLSVLPGGTVRVDGNMVVSGVYTSVQTTQLHVDETILQLATSSNGLPGAPDEMIGPAGLVIASRPTVAPPVAAAAAKSLLWNNGHSGTAGLMAPGPSGSGNESYWELRGGAFRLSGTDPGTGLDVGYEFRVAPQGLEVLQVWQSPALGGAKAFKRIGIFNGLPLT